MKIIELIMLYTGCKSIGRFIQTIVYVILMMSIVFFSAMICSVMK